MNELEQLQRGLGDGPPISVGDLVRVQPYGYVRRVTTQPWRTWYGRWRFGTEGQGYECRTCGDKVTEIVGKAGAQRAEPQRQPTG